MIIAQGQITISALNDGQNGISITSVDVEYCQSTSNTQLINPDWATSEPEWDTDPPSYESGKYIWTRTVITYSDANTDTTDPVCISGQDGHDGKGIVSVQEQYGKSSDRGTEPDSWVNSYDDLGTLTDADYVWTRNYITYTTGNPTVTDGVCVTGAKGDLADPPFNVILGNEFQAIPCNTSGNVKTNFNVTIPFSGYKGLTKIATSVTVPPVLGTGITLYNKTDSQDGGDGSIVLSFAGGSDLGGTIIGVVTFTFTLGDVSIPKSFTWMKVGEGDGSTIALYELSANTPYLNGTVTNTITPTTVTFNAVSKANAQATGSAYQGRFVITEVPTNGPTSNKYVSSVDESSVTYTLSTNTNLAAVKCSLYLSGGLIAKIDEVTVPVIFATALESKLVEITTSVSGVRTDVDAANQSITDEVWKNDVYTVLDKDGNTVNVSMANLLVQHSQDIRGINQTASQTVSDLGSLETNVSEMSQDYSRFKTTVSSTYQTKADTQANYALKTEVTQTASTLDTKISNEIENRETLIRAFEGGTLTCRIGQDYGVWTDANGAVKIVTVAWDEDDEPAIDEVVSSFGTDLVIGKAQDSNILINNNSILGFGEDHVQFFNFSQNGSQQTVRHNISLFNNEQIGFGSENIKYFTTDVLLPNSFYFQLHPITTSVFVQRSLTYGVATSWQISLPYDGYDVLLNVSYDGDNNFGIYSSSNKAFVCQGDIIYESTQYTPTYVLGRGTATGAYAISEGNGEASGSYSHAEGYNTVSSGNYAHSEGFDTEAALGSHSEGYDTHAIGRYSHAEGYGSETESNASYAHSEGYYTTAHASSSHAEGSSTQAIGISSHSEGDRSYAIGAYSHAQNHGTYATAEAGTVIGKYNEYAYSDVNDYSTYDAGNYALIIGNGTTYSNRSNALTVSWDGEVSLDLNTTAQSGVDHDLYTAITALGWTNDVIA